MARRLATAALHTPLWMWAGFLSVPAAVYVFNRANRPSDDAIRLELRRRGFERTASVSSPPTARDFADNKAPVSEQNRAVLEAVFANRHAKYWEPETRRRPPRNDPTAPVEK